MGCPSGRKLPRSDSAAGTHNQDVHHIDNAMVHSGTLAIVTVVGSVRQESRIPLAEVEDFSVWSDVYDDQGPGMFLRSLPVAAGFDPS